MPGSWAAVEKLLGCSGNAWAMVEKLLGCIGNAWAAMEMPGLQWIWLSALQMITALLLLISCTLDVLLAGLHLVAVHDQLLYCITARLQLHSIW